MKMLKNIYVLIIIAYSVASFWMISTKQMEQSDFLLRNVEALASGEESELSKDCGGCSTAYTYDCCTLITEIGTFYLKKL